MKHYNIVTSTAKQVGDTVNQVHCNTLIRVESPPSHLPSTAPATIIQLPPSASGDVKLRPRHSIHLEHRELNQRIIVQRHGGIVPRARKCSSWQGTCVAPDAARARRLAAIPTRNSGQTVMSRAPPPPSWRAAPIERPRRLGAAGTKGGAPAAAAPFAVGGGAAEASAPSPASPSRCMRFSW